MNGNYQRFLLVLATFVVAGLIAVPFLRRGKPTVTKDTPTLPLGLLLDKKQGKLTVVEAMEEAQRYGLEPGDILQLVDDFPVKSVAELRGALKEKSSGDQISMVVERGETMLTINRRFRGEMEVPSQSGTVYRVANVPKARDSSSDLPMTTVSQTKVMKKRWADFGMKFRDEKGRLIVESVIPNGAAAAYGVQPDDIVFQIDQTKITSLKDFHRVGSEKFAGDTANMMVIRGDDVVVIQEMMLPPSNATAQAPLNYQPQIYPFASLQKDALEKLLANPFDFEPDASTLHISVNTDSPGIVPNEPSLDGDMGVGLDLELGTPFPTESFAANSSKSDDTTSIELDAVGPNYSRTSPSYGKSVLVGDERKIDVSNPLPANELSEGDDLETPSLISKNALSMKKPNAIPRFNKYAGIRLKEAPFQGLTKSVDADQSDESKAQVSGMTLANPDDALEHIGQTRKKRTRTGPVSVKVENKSVLKNKKREELPSPSDTAELPSNEKAPDSLESTPSGQLSEVQDRAIGQPAAYSPPRIDITPLPAPNYSVGSQPVHPTPSYAAGSIVTSSPMGIPHQPVFSADAECQACGDWGCSECKWSSHDSKMFSLNRMLYGDAEPTISIGGWFSAGYHSASNDLFNNRPDNFALHQGWLYAEKTATEESPFGFRADIMYGIDADDTQSFGNPVGSWDFDNGFDHGPYGWALPQLYVELALGEWNIKAGHFYTLIGYEVVTAPDNFFYSHAMTMYNSEPFTHTGVIASRSVGDNVEVFAGWTLGWDTGFDRFNGGSSWLGGVSYNPNSDITLTYMSTAGNFGARGDDAYSHSVVIDMSLTEDLAWIVQSDYLRVGGTGEDNVGVNQYLTYSVSDKLAVGARMEWWKGDVLTGYAPHGGVLPAEGSLSYYAATLGVNFKPAKNLILRPEVRKDWSPSADYDETYFGMDAIFQF